MRLDVLKRCNSEDIKTKIEDSKTIVFCSNDDLTIGFLLFLEQSLLDWNNIKIISYDGTLPIKTLLNIKKLPIKYAIEQDLKILSEECISWIEDMRNKNNNKYTKELDLKVIQ